MAGSQGTRRKSNAEIEDRLSILEYPKTASYSRGTAQSIPTAGTGSIIDFNVLSHNDGLTINTGANWEFIATEDGIYEINANVQFDTNTWATGSAYYMYFNKYSSSDVLLDTKLVDDQCVQAAFTYYKTLKGTAIFKLIAGQKLKVLVVHTAGSNRSLRAGTASNFVDIKKVK